MDMRILAAYLALALSAAAQNQVIDTRRSTITVHVGKAGLFSAAGHGHTISASITAGEFSEKENPHVALTVDARAMTVKTEEGVSSKDQAEIQETMHRKVLESGKYPTIKFQSSSVRKVAEGIWKIGGTLTLHGVDKPVNVDVKRARDDWTGTARIKQTDFGIQPVTIAGGVVKVKNELEISFEIYPASSASTAASRSEYSNASTRIPSNSAARPACCSAATSGSHQ
jgi:polyisoprenoid-binding protein YceI